LISKPLNASHYCFAPAWMVVGDYTILVTRKGPHNTFLGLLILWNKKVEKGR
jgi:hypothetical protein